eukprot:1519479-Prymnesium_polylepis.1
MLPRPPPPRLDQQPEAHRGRSDARHDGRHPQPSAARAAGARRAAGDRGFARAANQGVRRRAGPARRAERVLLVHGNLPARRGGAPATVPALLPSELHRPL